MEDMDEPLESFGVKGADEQVTVGLSERVCEAKLLFERAVAQLTSEDVSVDNLLPGARTLRQVLQSQVDDDKDDGDGAADMVIGDLNKILGKHLRRDESPELQKEVVWALSNILSDQKEKNRCKWLTQLGILTGGIVPDLVRLLRSPDRDVVSNAMWCLMNIAGSCVTGRDKCWRSSIVQPLLDMKTDALPHQDLETYANLLSNLVRGPKKDSISEGDMQPVVEAAARFLQHTNENVARDACWTLVHAADGCMPDYVELVSRMGIETTLGELLEVKKLVEPALLTLGNLATGTDHQTQRVIDSGVLPRVMGVLTSREGPGQEKNQRMIKASCWMLSNIAAGTQAQVRQLLDQCEGLVGALVGIASEEDVDERVLKEAFHVLGNLAVSSADEGVAAVVNGKALPLVVKFLLDPDALPSPTRPAKNAVHAFCVDIIGAVELNHAKYKQELKKLAEDDSQCAEFFLKQGLRLFDE
eukprot:TRINITY_DN154_c0_g1_i2.p1 TRINITY_DN154_c0_g1~~TRINITY_DN154_c0_g1_i2.p1  ORF type:complete len:546 (+),score=90.82 TRINITY_DN154_c0_g1_i2:225-1640(+)